MVYCPIYIFHVPTTVKPNWIRSFIKWQSVWTKPSICHWDSRALNRIMSSKLYASRQCKCDVPHQMNLCIKSKLILLSSTRPFYGYHPNEHRFLKIYFYNPMFIRRAANLLQNGAILNKIHQPHESHLPYLLQFFIDFNLYGMSFLHVPADVVRYRRRPQRSEQSDGTLRLGSKMS